MNKIFLAVTAALVVLLLAISVSAIQLGDDTTKASNFRRNIVQTATVIWTLPINQSGIMTCSVQDEPNFRDQAAPVVNNINLNFSIPLGTPFAVTNGTPLTVTVRGR